MTEMWTQNTNAADMAGAGMGAQYYGTPNMNATGMGGAYQNVPDMNTSGMGRNTIIRPT